MQTLWSQGRIHSMLTQPKVLLENELKAWQISYCETSIGLPQVLQ